MGPLPFLKALLVSVVRGLGASLVKHAGQIAQESIAKKTSRRQSPKEDGQEPEGENPRRADPVKPSVRAAAGKAMQNAAKPAPKREEDAPWSPKSIAGGVIEAFSLVLKQALGKKKQEPASAEEGSGAEKRSPIRETVEGAKQPDPAESKPKKQDSGWSLNRIRAMLSSAAKKSKPPEAEEDSEEEESQEKSSKEPHRTKRPWTIRRAIRRLMNRVPLTRNFSRETQKQRILDDMAKQSASQKQAQESQEAQAEPDQPEVQPRKRGFFPKLPNMNRFRAKSVMGSLLGGMAGAGQTKSASGNIDYGKIISMAGKPQSEVNAAKQKMSQSAATASSGGMLGKFAATVGWIVKLGAVTYGLYKSFKLFGEVVLENRRDLTKFNGAIAAAFARLDVQKVHQQIDLGRKTQESSVRLAEAMRELNETNKENVEALTTVMNFIALVAVKGSTFLAAIFKEINVFIPIAELIEKNTKKKEDEKLPMNDLLESIASGKGRNPLPKM